MASDAEPGAPEPDGGPRPVRRRKRLLPFAVLAAGGLVAAYVAARAPRDQHVKLVLGPGADQVTALEMQYVAEDGDVARDVRMGFSEGKAPRIVSHEPKLADGDYRLRIDLDTREGRRSVERRVTLGGGTTQVDLAAVVTATPPAPASALPSPSSSTRTAP